MTGLSIDSDFLSWPLRLNLKPIRMTRRSGVGKGLGEKSTDDGPLPTEKVTVEIISKTGSKPKGPHMDMDIKQEDEAGPSKLNNENIPDFDGDFDELLKYHLLKVEEYVIAKATMNRRIIELEYELKKTKAKLAKAVTGAPMLPPCRMSKKDKQAAAKDILSKYFSEAQISYLIDYKGRESNGMGECGEGDDVKITTSSRKGTAMEKPSVKWSSSDLNKFAKLKAHVRISGYTYLRRMNIVPMPSVNVLQKAHREGNLEPDTIQLMEEKMQARIAAGSVPKTGSVDVYLKEEDDKVFSPSGKKKKDHSDSASYNYASARKKARLERNECPENKRQLNLVMAAIQANNLPSIIIRKRHRDPQNGSTLTVERTLFTPHAEGRTGEWNDEDFDTIISKRTITGHNRRPPATAAQKAKISSKVDPHGHETGSAGSVITYDQDGNAYTLKKEDQITIIEQQDAIDSIATADGQSVQVQAVPLAAQGTTTVPGDLTIKQQPHQVLQIGTIGGNQLVLHPIGGSGQGVTESGGNNTVTFITQDAPTSFDQIVSSGSGSATPGGTQVVYTTTEDGQVIQSHYQTVGYTTTAVDQTEVSTQGQEIQF